LLPLLVFSFLLFLLLFMGKILAMYRLKDFLLNGGRQATATQLPAILAVQEC
jgi:hypothetical protein